MEISDERGRPLQEVTVRLSEEEVTELLVAASELESDPEGHAMIRSPDGSTLAVYRSSEGPSELQRGTDWWLGPLILLAVVLLLVGAFTIGRGVVDLLF